MPDTLKQFYNASINVTGLTGNQTATLFTNNSTTRAVIKDVDVVNTFPVQPNLTVGGASVATLVGSVTGSEIVDTSQAVAISFPTALEYSRGVIQYISDAGGNGTRTNITYNRINGVSVSSTTVSLGNASSRLDTVHGYYYVAADNDVFFYQTDGATTFRLSKRAGGPTGTATNISSGLAPVAFDGRYYYYITSATTLIRFDPETETTTTTTLASGLNGPGSGARLVHSNGYLVYIYADGAQPAFIKLSNGYWVQTAWNGMYMGNIRSQPGFFIDPTTLVATVVYVDGSSQTYRVVSNGAVGSFATASQTLSSNTSTQVLKTNGTWSIATGISTPMVTLTSATTGLMNFSSGGTYTVDVSGSTTNWTNAGPINATTDVNFLHSYVTPSVTTPNTTDFPSTISLRVTGVEVTP